MKNIKFGILYLMLVLTVSCQKFLDVNVDPNNPSTTKLSLTLTSGIVYSATALGDPLAQIGGYWAQYWTGRPGISLQSWDKHQYTGSSSNYAWSFYYARGLADLNYVSKSKEPHYNGIAKILLAYHFQVLVDCFGDIPYTEAFKGAIEDGGNVSPKFDKAEDIYQSLITQIDDAIQDLQVPSVAGMLEPASDDVIFGGDLYKWEQFANSLKLKIYIRLANTSYSAEAATKFSEVWDNSDVILDNADCCLIPFTGGTNSFNPLYAGDRGAPAFTSCETSVQFLNLTDDKRIGKFYNQVTPGIYKGVPYGDIENQPTNEALFSNFKLPSFVYKSSAPVILMSAYEVYFILAEASVRGWIGDDAEELYNNGVKLSFDYLGLSSESTAYLESAGIFDATNDATKIKSIAIQKWIAFNGTQNTESWIETRRFDTPTQTIFRGTGGIFRSPTTNLLGANVFPSILLYSDSELSFNPNAPTQHTLTDKVFWDN